MPTFRRVEIVDARQFTGGLQQGSDLAFWVNSNHGLAHWYPERLVGQKTLSERIILHTPDYVNYSIVWLDDWIVRHQDGSWEALRPEDLKEQYEEV
jgi:hypothetical protein